MYGRIDIIRSHDTGELAVIIIYHLCERTSDYVGTPVIAIPKLIDLFLLVSIAVITFCFAGINELRSIRNVETVGFEIVGGYAGNIAVLCRHITIHLVVECVGIQQ